MLEMFCRSSSLSVCTQHFPCLCRHVPLPCTIPFLWKLFKMFNYKFDFSYKTTLDCFIRFSRKTIQVKSVEWQDLHTFRWHYIQLFNSSLKAISFQFAAQQVEILNIVKTMYVTPNTRLRGKTLKYNCHKQSLWSKTLPRSVAYKYE
jgi:hypothetical protein